MQTSRKLSTVIDIKYSDLTRFSDAFLLKGASNFRAWLRHLKKRAALLELDEYIRFPQDGAATHLDQVQHDILVRASTPTPRAQNANVQQDEQKVAQGQETDESIQVRGAPSAQLSQASSGVRPISIGPEQQAGLDPKMALVAMTLVENSVSSKLHPQLARCESASDMVATLSQLYGDTTQLAHREQVAEAT